jgi:uncharacterized protein (TIGR03437 family)
MRTILYISLLVRIAAAQLATVIEIETENDLFYNYDTPELSKFATSPAIAVAFGATPGGAPRNFWQGVYIADIVAVNGRPARGVMARRGTRLSLTPSPNSGQAISDVTRSFIDDGVWEIQQADGTQVGTFTTHGFIGGPPALGAPTAATGTNLAVTGGTGAFLGARGQVSGAPVRVPAAPRPGPSITEDPANRRTNGGGRSRFLLQLIPNSRPEIVSTANGLAIVHASDGRLVTTSNPASRGEALVMYARFLGPTLPAIDPGQPFPATPAALVASPVEITVDATRAPVLYAGGYSGSNDLYQVNFIVPEGVAAGTATLQLSSAWISGSPAQIAVK